MHTFVRSRARANSNAWRTIRSHALPRVHFLLDGNLVLGPGLEPPADADIKALGVLAENHEVDVPRRASFQRAQPLVQEPDRAVVRVEIELEPGAEQDVARVPIVGHTRIAKRADEDRIELPQPVVAVRRDRDTGLEK